MAASSSSQKVAGSTKTLVEEPEGTVFQTVLFYSLAILLAPIATFAVIKGALSGIEVETHTSNIWAAIIAIIVLHLMLGLYIYRTFYPASKQTKQD